jgi:Zn-dependent peptidase ImmA (M78 family)
MMKVEVEMQNDDMTTIQRFAKQTPVRIENLISELGVKYIETDLAQGKSGYIERSPDGYRIVVNKNEGPQRRRFTAAHELAHYILHRDMLEENGVLHRHEDALFDVFARSNVSYPFSPSHEVQANRYAAELLMPSSAVKTKYVKDPENIADLAQAFGVSQKAMKIRLNNLGLRSNAE